MRCDLVAGAVRRIKERDNCVAHALVRHKAPARVGLLGLCAGAFPFRLRFVKALLELLCVEVGAGVVAGVPELRPRIARPGGDRRIEVVAAVARNEPRLALVGAAVAVRCRVQQVGNVHLRLVEPRVVDIEVVQVILEVHAVAAAVVPQPVVAHRGADDLIAGLLAVGVVQDGEIVRPVLVEISVIRQLLPADNVDLRARLVRGLHLILEVPQLQHRAVGGEVAERIGELELRHAHVGDRVLDRAGRIFIIFRHGIGHRAFFELRHALGGIVVHRGVDRIDLFVQAENRTKEFAAVFFVIAGKAEVDRAVLLLQKIDLIRLTVTCLFAMAAPSGLVVLYEIVDRRSFGAAEERVEGLLFQRVFLHRAVNGCGAPGVAQRHILFSGSICRGAEGGVSAVRKAVRKGGRFI